jgi:hypothetical protein
VTCGHRALWFDACMDADEQRIRELERGFRRDGLPNLIVDLSAAEDVFTRALPFLAVVFVLEIANAFAVTAGWAELLLVLGIAAALVLGFGLLNVARGRGFLSIPRRVGVPELVVFVALPALLPVVLDGHWRFGLVTLMVNLAIVGLAYVVVGFGLVFIVLWVVARLFSLLGASMVVLVRAVPLLLFFSLVAFFTTEIWQVFNATGLATFWTAVGMFVLLGMGFLAVRMPGVVREVLAESHLGDVPLRRRERVNLALVALLSEALQVGFVSGAVWLFYVLLGALLVPADVREVWLVQPHTVLVDVAWFGERVQVTSALLRVATGVAGFAGLYYAVTILVDAAYRDQFVDALTEQLRETFARRAEYLELLRRRGAQAVPDESGER